MRWKKFLTILMTVAMIVSLLPATAYAAKNTATTMRLAKTQGTVTVTNATGKAVSQTDNMKLYNGYKVKTGAKSYAWISLDDTKVAKLDANSVMEVQKSGKALTLFLSSGNLFFNVKDPLKSGESFQVKTSTMTTGIRGTSGCVRVISDRVTEIHLLTGEVLVYVEHPGLNVKKTAILKAGQKATSLIDWEAMQISGEMAEIIIEKLENHEICGVCAEEIAKDPELLARIQREAPHLFPEIAAAEAEERLAADEAAAEEKQKQIDEAIAEQVFPEDVDPYFEDEPSSGGGGGGSAASAETVVEVSSLDELLQAIEDYNNGEDIDRIKLTGDADAAAVGEDLPAIEDHGPLTLDLGTNTLTLNNTLVNHTDLTITNEEGTIIGPGGGPAVENNNILTVEDGTIDGNGDIGIQHIAGELIVESAATITNSVTAIDANAGEVYIDDASFDNISDNVIHLEADAVLTLNGMTIGENMENARLVYNYFGKVIVEGGTITHNNRFIYNQGGEVILNGGTIELTLPESNTSGINSLNGGTVEMNGGSLTASGGGAVLEGDADAGTLTLNGGTITTVEDVVAVNHQSTLARPVQTVVRWEYPGEAVTDEADIQYKLMGNSWDTFMTFTTSGGTDTTIHEMTDVYGTIAADATVVDAQTFLEALQNFNNGGADSTITLAPPNGMIDVTAADEEAYGPLEVNNTASVLTIDLAGMALTIENALAVTEAANVVITDSVGGGTMSGGADALITNNGTFELKNGTLAANNTTITGTGDTIISGGVIDVTMEGLTAINVEDGGSLTMSGGTINLAESARSSMAVNMRYPVSAEMSGGSINLSGTGQTGIAFVGDDTDLILSGGAITEVNQEEYTDNCAVQYVKYGSSGSVVLSGTAITMNYGTGVSVDDTSEITLGNGVVKALDPAALLVTENVIESGFGAAGPDENGYYTLIEQEDIALTASDSDTLIQAFQRINEETGPFTLTLTDNIAMTVSADTGEDIMEYLTVPEDKEVKLNLNGYNLNLNEPMSNYGTLTIEGAGTIAAADGVTLTELISNNGNLFINGGTFEVNGANSYGIYANAGKLVVSNATFNVSGYCAAGIYHYCSNDGIGSVTRVNGGTFNVAEDADRGAYGIMYSDNTNLSVAETAVTFNLPADSVNAVDVGIDPTLN